jgi:hypothetical protein
MGLVLDITERAASSRKIAETALFAGIENG